MIPLNTTAIITRPVRTADGSGGFTLSTAVVGTIPCRISNPESSDTQWGGVHQEDVAAVLYALPQADIRLSDRVTVREVTYEALTPTTNSIPAFLRVRLKYVKH